MFHVIASYDAPKTQSDPPLVGFSGIIILLWEEIILLK